MFITIAGATGYIGKNLIERLLPKYKVKGLSRSKRESCPEIEWVEADLFSYQSTQNALKNTDVAIYLVHSMLPSTRLFQGNFQDTDLLIADNFAKACIKNGVKQIIYLGGLVPNVGQSKHLESRKEVEDVFKQTGIPLTILRAGMVVGDGGSSFEILRNLVFNLPGMILPRWTKSNTQTIYLDDLLAVINDALANDVYYNKTINVVNGEKINYEELIAQSAEYFGRKKIMIPVPINYTSFSKLWVSVFGEADYELVSPLIDSLLCELPSPKVPNEIAHLIKYKTYREMLLKLEKVKRNSKKKNLNTINSVNSVRSIQRLPNPDQLSQDDLSQEYINWLPKHLRFLVKAKSEGDLVEISTIGLDRPLLVLKRQKITEELERVKFHIVGGLLSKNSDSGWLEFRLVAGGKYTLVSINEFIPSLPWYFYKYTQAPCHAVVMRSFGKFLQRHK